MCWFGRRCGGLVGDVLVLWEMCWFGRKCGGFVGDVLVW